MTNTTKTTKCDSTCNHSSNQFGFTQINLSKWHKCHVCNKMQLRNWIMRHQMQCEASAKYLNEKKGGLN